MVLDVIDDSASVGEAIHHARRNVRGESVSRQINGKELVIVVWQQRSKVIECSAIVQPSVDAKNGFATLLTPSFA